ncbi:hypothetical protein [Laspinema olomoucense]|uniref:hypothetical protein n=1 Tax=Laspinema olomoucense TaxID=3231600 RepID=UPI0021BA5AFF|nr:hypothetical protein [Laspinema sp. D3d]MCT7971169.1 hypothetical protein [Laspinema sp. D3d]
MTQIILGYERLGFRAWSEVDVTIAHQDLVYWHWTLLSSLNNLTQQYLGYLSQLQL